MKSKLDRAFNAAVHLNNIEQQYSRSNVEVVDDNFNIISDNFSSKDKETDYNSTGYKAQDFKSDYRMINNRQIESDLIKVNKTIKLINDNQLLKCLNRTMLNNNETSSSPLDDQLSHSSNGSSANTETNKISEQLELVPISSPGDTGLIAYQQHNQTNLIYVDHCDSPDNSNSEWSTNQPELDFEQHPKKRRIQTRQSTALANQLNDQLQNNQLQQLQQLLLVQQQLNALRGQQQQQREQSVLSNQLLNQLTKDSSDPDTMSNAVVSNILNGSMNMTQLNQHLNHLNQLNQLSQLGLTNSPSITSLIQNLSSNQSPSSQSNQTSPAFNLSINRNSSTPNIVLSSNVASNANNLQFLVSNSNNNSSASAVVTSNHSNQPTNSTVTSQSMDSNKKPFDLCLVCGDKASGRHYNAISCEGCKGFFKRSVRKQLNYACRANQECEVTKHHRNRCQFCRLQKCIRMGMRADHCQPERKPLALESNSNNNRDSFNKHNIPTNQLIANSLTNQTGQTNLKQQSPFSSFSSRDLSNVNQSQSTKATKNNSSTAESVLLNAIKQQHLINSTNKKQEALAAVILDANNNRISNVNNNNAINSSTSLSSSTAAALNLAPVNHSIKNSNLSTNNNSQTKCKSPSTADLKTFASVVNLLALNSQDQSDLNNNSLSCKNQNDLLLSCGAVKQKVVADFLDANNNTELHSNNNPLTSTSLLMAASNLNDFNSTILQQQDCNNNKLTSESLSPNNQNNLGITKAAFEMMVKMASGNANSGSPIDNPCKNPLKIEYHADGGSSNNMDSEDQNTTTGQNDFELDVNQILEDEQFDFRLTPPPNSNSFPNLQYICEYSTKLLFLSVSWAQSITVFKKFTDQTQQQLLRSCWCDLFILGLSHCSQHLSLSTIVTAIVTQLQTLTSQNKIQMKEAIDYLYKLNKFVNSLQSMQLDDKEYAYLKAILLFCEDNLSNSDLPMNLNHDESKMSNKQNSRLVSTIQSHVVNELNTYILDNYVNEQDGKQKQRFAKLLLRLMNLKSLSQSITEQLFFSGLIGSEVQIDNVIPYILRMENNELNVNEFNVSSSSSRFDKNYSPINDKDASSTGNSPLNQSTNENVATQSVYNATSLQQLTIKKS